MHLSLLYGTNNAELPPRSYM